jgi:flagellar biosynthesis GTPase FlhF
MGMIGHNNPTMTIESLSAEDKKVLRKAIIELNDSMTRAGAERELQKEIMNETNGKLGVDKRLIRRMAKAYFKANFNDEVEENNTFESFYDEVMRKTAS